MNDDVARPQPLRTRHYFSFVGRPHDLSDSCDCWCHPILSIICPACEDATGRAECWQCGGASHIPATRDDVGPYDVVVVFHRPMPGGRRLAGDPLSPISWALEG